MTKTSVHNGATGLCKKQGASMISQAELAEYEELKPMAERFKVLAEQLKTAVDAGTPVEPGPLAPKMTVYFRRRLLLDYVFKRLALSKKEIDKLRKDAPEVRHRSLAIVVNPSSLLTQPAPNDGQSVKELSVKVPQPEPIDWDADDLLEKELHDLVYRST